MVKRNLLIITLMAALATPGCGRRSDLPPLAKVVGVVTLDGQPLKTGTIQFIPDKSKGTAGRMAVGGIGSDGHFEMTTLVEGDGAQVGHHLVGIQAYEVVGSQNSDSPTPIESKALIPEKYGDAATSGLTAEVVSGKVNTIHFDLKSRP